MEKGRVFWITGLPGSGKTTIGNALYYSLRKKRNNVLILDGDILKTMIGSSVGYEKNDRLARGKKYSEICKYLSDQGLWVIICTVAMFEEIRRWNRENISEYVEVFLNTPIEVLMKRNKKGLYTNGMESFSYMEFPRDPDIIIENEDGISLDDCVGKIEAITPRKLNDYDRDRVYWNNYYKSVQINRPSAFAEYVLNDLKQNKVKEAHLLEIGCGNGRDSLFFLDNGYRVTGVDISDRAISALNDKCRNNKNAFFVCDDGTRCKTLYQTKYDVIYIRWVIHAVTEEQETELFCNILEALDNGGRVYIEARTVGDDLYGKGECVGRNSYIYNGHFRRFIDGEELKRKLNEIGYKIESYIEGRGFSKTEKEDPVLCRIIISI